MRWRSEPVSSIFMALSSNRSKNKQMKKSIFEGRRAGTRRNWISVATQWEENCQPVCCSCATPHTSTLFHSSGLIYPLAPPAIHINSFAPVPVDGCNRRRWTPSLHWSASDTPLCTTVTCRTSQMQATEETGHNFRICACASTAACIMHISEKAPRRVPQREGPLSQVGLKDTKNAVLISCLSLCRKSLFTRTLT